MRILDAAAVEAALDYPRLIEALREAFRVGATVPLRSHHTIPTDGAPGTLLLMPAWTEGGPIGVKLATVFPDNAGRDLPAVQATYLLLDGRTGVPLALLEGRSLTARRTAAASALAADYLARRDAERLLVVGTGAVARQLAAAYPAVRPIREVMVWGRNPDKAAAFAAAIRRPGLAAEAVADLDAAVGRADIVSCATLATAPLIAGDRLRPGTHLDLVGSFTPQMREADDAAVRRATLFVDTRAGALKEGGDLADPIRRGVIRAEDVAAELADLAAGRHRGRDGEAEITLFKSVGTAIEDLAAARLVLSGPEEG